MFYLENKIKLLICVFPQSLCAQSEHMNNLDIRLDFRPNVIKRKYWQALVVLFPLSITEKIWMKNKLNFVHFSTVCAS